MDSYGFLRMYKEQPYLSLSFLLSNLYLFTSENMLLTLCLEFNREKVCWSCVAHPSARLSAVCIFQSFNREDVVLQTARVPNTLYMYLCTFRWHFWPFFAGKCQLEVAELVKGTDGFFGF